MENRRRKMQKTRVRSQMERRKRTTRRRMRVKRVKQRRRRKKRLRRLGIARRVTRRMRRRRIVRLNSVPPIFLRRLPRRPSRDLEMIIKPQHVHTKPCHHYVEMYTYIGPLHITLLVIKTVNLRLYISSIQSFCQYNLHYSLFKPIIPLILCWNHFCLNWLRV